MDYSLDILKSMTIEVPLWQLAVFITFITFLMLFQRYRLCLVVTYLCTLFLVFIENSDKFGQTHYERIFFVSLFIGSGFIITVLTIWSLYRDSRD